MVRRGGEVDPDCPDDPESVRFWATTGGSYEDKAKSKMKMSSEGRVAAGGETLGALLDGGPDAGYVPPSAGPGPSLQQLVGVMDSTPASTAVAKAKAKAKPKAAGGRKADPKTPEEWRKAAGSLDKKFYHIFKKKDKKTTTFILTNLL